MVKIIFEVDKISEADRKGNKEVPGLDSGNSSPAK